MNDFTKSGEFIAEMRKAKGMTQSELGELIGTGDKTISKWERGINVPDVIMLNNIAKVFNVSIHEILNGKRDEKLDPKFVKLYENRKIRYSLVGLLIVILISFIILLLYFGNNYDKFRIYRFDSKSDDYKLTGNIYQVGKRYELIIDDFCVYDTAKYDDFEIFDYKLNFYVDGKNILSFAGVNTNESEEEKEIKFDELVTKINEINILVSKFKPKTEEFDGMLKLELVNNEKDIIEEYKINCFLEYHNNRIYYIK